MTLVNGKITKPVSLDDIGQCLSKSSRDLGTLCEADNIKFWAKYHPIREDSPEELSEAVFKANAYGIKLDITEWRINNSSHIQTAFNKAIQGVYSWVYLKPRGIAYNEWYRELDFDGYNHNAECPFMLEGQDLTRGKLNVGFSIINVEDDNISLADLKEIGGGILITNDPNTRYGIIYSKDGGTPVLVGGSANEAAFTDNKDYRDVDISVDSGVGTYRVVPIIINATNNLFATIPMRYKEYEVTNENAGSLKPSLFGTYRADSTGSKTIISGSITTMGAALPNTGYVEVFLCYNWIEDTSKLDDAVTNGTAVKVTYSFSAMGANDTRTFGSTVNYNPYTIQIVWARVTTTTVGVVVNQFEYEERDDIS